ncbi:MAG TPA: ABC transporter ATP-binding protein [Burkholderiales bacterium]|nr:ABC transporter ATP-binding protein [Burkholderiales bacterium]
MPLSSVPQSIVRVVRLTRQVPNGDGLLTILHDVSFAVEAGEAVAITGVSGSGKSTLLGLIAGLDVPSAGEVWIDGVSLFTLGEDARAALRGQKLGFVFQSFQLLPMLTALENVMLPLELAGRSDARRTAESVLERVGLDSRMHHYPSRLSGGEQQRVAIARAFAGRPQLLLADEPTGSLDAASGERIADLLFELNRENRATLLLVTHDAALSQRCGRRIELRAGALADADHPA